jgi:hypothetical protein
VSRGTLTQTSTSRGSRDHCPSTGIDGGGVPAACTVNVNACATDGPLASDTTAAMLADPATVGVPLITPAWCVKPAGSVPVTDQSNGG